MVHDFHLRAELRRSAAGPVIEIKSSYGNSVVVSHDGSATIAILGATGREEDASLWVRRYVEGRRRVESCATAAIGTVVLDHLRCELWVVAAPIGLRQIYWKSMDTALSVGATPALLGIEEPLRLHEQSLYDYVYFHMIPGSATIFSGMAKLDAGHRLRWDSHRVEVERYWTPAFCSRPAESEVASAATLHELLDRAVARCVEVGVPTGAFLSGGLDSSTVAGKAARLLPGLPTVSMGFDVQGYDEMEFARIAARRFGTRPLEYYVTADDLLATLPRIAAAFAEPFGNSSAAAAYHCARIARDHGLQRLLAGDGGDEIFGGNERYAKQMVFERYGLVPAAVRRGLLEPVVGAAARVTQAFPVGKAQSYIQQARLPLPDRLQSYNFLHRHDPVEVFSDDLLAVVDRGRPLRLLRDEYRAPIASDAVNRMLFLDWKFTLHDNDLVKVNAMCAMAGVDVVYPMLDQDLVEFSLRLPADWKVRRNTLRRFYKRALRGFLPDEIIEKKKHGFGLPFGIWTRTHRGLQQLSMDALQTLGERRLFKHEFLAEALRLHREGHASYHGELVWVLMMLELWLRQHAPRYGM